MDHEYDQVAYWNAAAPLKTFTHPCDFALLAAHLGNRPKILDVGCGYGRLCRECLAHGFPAPVGTDFSEGMLARARSEVPECSFALMRTGLLPFPDETFDLALLFAVLTCIETDAEQDALIRETARVLKPGGLIYVSDYPLQQDGRNIARYEHWARQGMSYGTFVLPGGGIMRHHAPERIVATFSGRFRQLDMRSVSLRTMNGHTAAAYQYMGRKLK